MLFISIGVSLLQSQVSHKMHAKNWLRALLLFSETQFSCHYLWYKGIATKEHIPLPRVHFYIFISFFLKYMAYSGAYSRQESMSHVKNYCFMSLKLCGLHNDNALESTSGIMVYFLSCILKNVCGLEKTFSSFSLNLSEFLSKSLFC